VRNVGSAHASRVRVRLAGWGRAGGVFFLFECGPATLGAFRLASGLPSRCFPLCALVAGSSVGLCVIVPNS
jgi:hypothetical protein